MISIIVAVYNVEQYLRECLDSICAQSRSDLEVIMVDDESSDLSIDICKEYAKKDYRFKHFRIKHSGTAAGRAIGFSNSVGEYVSFVDGDDWLDTQYCEKLVCELENDKDVDISVCNFYMGEKRANEWEGIRLEGKTDIFCAYISSGIYNRMWNKMYRRKIIEGTKFSYGRDQFEDGFWMPQAIGKSNCIVRIPDCLYHYRIRNGSLMRKKKTSKEIGDEILNSFGRIDTLLSYNQYIKNDYAIKEYDTKISAIVKSGYNIKNFSIYETIRDISNRYSVLLHGKSWLYEIVTHANSEIDFYSLYWRHIRKNDGKIVFTRMYISYFVHKLWRLFDK